VRVKGVAGVVTVSKEATKTIPGLAATNALTHPSFPEVVSESKVLGDNDKVALHTPTSFGIFSPKDVQVTGLPAATGTVVKGVFVFDPVKEGEPAL
jgi:hypothetical protein